ncbi:MAG: glycosyltransferase family 2 protein [Cyanobacteria bacterium P01_A01_bin.45]
MKIEDNSQEPLVSIITPTYNRPEYLKVALESALSQTYRNIEVIVSDNCSSENPQTLIESFNDSRIRFSRNESNLGMFANTMKAFKMARGKYVGALLDDDMWEDDFLAKLVPPLEANPDLVLAFCDHHMMDADGKIDVPLSEHCSELFNRKNLSEGVYQPFSKVALVDRSVSTATAALMRRSVIDWESIPPEVGGSWDMYLNYLYSRTGKGAYYCPQKLTRYRVHEQTDTMQSGSRNSQAKIRKAKADIFCYEKFIDDGTLKELEPYFRKQWVHISTTLGIGLMRSQQLCAARPYFWRSLKQKFSLRTVTALLISFTTPSIAQRF